MAGVRRDPVSQAIQTNDYATGGNRYGALGSSTATTGPVDKTGYAERDRANLQRRALLQRLAAMNPSGTLNLDVLGRRA